ncbi:hypothetical protein [Paracoccus salsus]|uniref:hypothetical protein n=1 Tax=Paracoccus salsus TaxID=2911061 RepID=UPI001F3A3D99|nr:hypothetical protein [Paracoccus salsus]MCF3973946.1 hypothetical protein [Paracoccus salsus]
MKLTPAGAFVRSSAWLPADDPSSEGLVRHFYRPSDVWVSSNERFPFYLRQVAVTIGKIIDRRRGALRIQAKNWVMAEIAGTIECPLLPVSAVAVLQH